MNAPLIPLEDTLVHSAFKTPGALVNQWQDSKYLQTTGPVPCLDPPQFKPRVPYLSLFLASISGHHSPLLSAATPQEKKHQEIPDSHFDFPIRPAAPTGTGCGEPPPLRLVSHSSSARFWRFFGVFWWGCFRSKRGWWSASGLCRLWICLLSL
jgi:hypothetical protein